MNKKHFLATQQKGFTLIELLTVIGVLGVLAAGLLVIINPGTQLAKSRDSKRKSDLHQLQLALEQYYNDHQQYPIHCENQSSPTHSPTSTKILSGNATWFKELEPYIKSMPTDPKNVNNYPNGPTTFQYQYQSKNIGTLQNKLGPTGNCDATGQHYELGTHLENASDPQINWDFTDFWDGWFVNYVVTN